MAEMEATGKLKEQNFASELGKQKSGRDKAENKADAEFFQDDKLQELDEKLLDPNLPDFEHVYYDVAEEADDELDSDHSYEEIRPLIIKKAKSGKDGDQVHLSTNHPEQTTHITAHTHSHEKFVDNLAQAQKTSTEASHSAPIAPEDDLPQAATPHPELLSVHHVSDLLHPSPPLRRRKGSRALRLKLSDSDNAHSMMPKPGKIQDVSYGHDQDHTAEESQNSDTYLIPAHRGKMPEARGNQSASSGENQGNMAEIAQSCETSTSSGNSVMKRKTSGFPKADAVLGYGEEATITPKKSMTNLVTSPKASHEKKSLRNLFHRKGSKESTTPPFSLGKTANRMTISGPNLVDASPNAKLLLGSASSLVDASLGAKNVVNYSRPIVPHSSSDASNGSPVVRGPSSSVLHSSNPTPGLNSEGLADKSGNISVGLNTSLMNDHPGASAVRGRKAADKQNAIPEGSATEKNPDASDSDSFDPSDYSGDENSVQQAVAMPIVFRGRAKLVDVRPSRGTNITASGNQSDVRIADAPGRAQFTNQEAEDLGAQDAERYYKNTMNSQTHPNAATDDPFIDPPYRKLLAKPANEIAAKEMARLKAAREAGNTGGGLMERMNALLAKSEVENTGGATANPRTNPRANTSESLVSKIRALGKKSKKGKEQEDGEEEVVRNVEADKERCLREERAINAIIKAKLAAKDAANGGVRGAGIPRIDYGPPNPRTALGGSGVTDEERAHARNLTSRRAAGLTGGRVQNEGDKTTARGQFEGY